jgi:hypothetical protein
MDRRPLLADGDGELVACRRCARVLVDANGSGCTPDHRDLGLTCNGSGDSGFALGVARWYLESRDQLPLIFVGDERTEVMRVLPHSCSEELTKIRMPPDDAFNRRLQIETACLNCRRLVRLSDYEEGPDGLLRYRR